MENKLFLDLDEDFGLDMPLPSYFDFNKCLPNELDFKRIAERRDDFRANGENANWISTPWGMARSTKDVYKKIKYIVVALLIDYPELVEAYKKVLQKDISKDNLNTIFDWIKTRISYLTPYANKYALKEALTEASTLTPLEKMQAYNRGTRRENVQACSDEKLLSYDAICYENTLWVAKRGIDKELITRGYGKQVVHLTYSDFNSEMIKNIEHAIDSGEIYKFVVYTLEKLTDAITPLLAHLIMGICLDAPEAFIDRVTFVLRSYIDKEDIKYYINKCLSNKDLINHITKCINEVLTESVNEKPVKIDKTIIGKFAAKMDSAGDPRAAFGLDLSENIEKHGTLNPKLWTKNTKLLPEVKEKILEIVDRFKQELNEDNIKINIEDIILVGSNVNFNYTKDSDLDIHIIADTMDLDCPEELYKAIYSAYRSLFNKKFDIDFYGIPVEIYVETEGVPRVSSGCYSVLHDKWLKTPSIVNIPDIDQIEFYKKFTSLEDAYKALISSPDLTAELIEKFIEHVYDLRKDGLAKGDEWSEQNLLFKEFRNRGYLDNLKELKNIFIGRKLSLDVNDNSDVKDTYKATEESTSKIIQEDTKKIADHKWVNKGKDGTHGEFSTKKEADAQRKAMFANGYHESLDEDIINLTDKEIYDFRIKLKQVVHNSVLVHRNGLFEIYQVKENDVSQIINQLNRLDYVDWVQKTQTGYDFGHFNFSQGARPQQYFRIYGQLKK